MKKALTAALFICLTLMNSKAQNVGIGTTTPLEKLSVGSISQFQINANGNIVRINNIPYSYPSIQGTANQVLLNDGSGNLTWASAPAPVVSKPVVRIFSIVPNGVSAWAIDNSADYNASPFNQNPTLVLYRGLTYQFSINASGHPFRIATGPSPAPAYTVGISSNDVQVGTITFTVPMDAPSTLHYYCTIHTTTMTGNIVIP
jgi:hypothetical protein